MKSTLFAIFLLVSSLSFADIGELHQRNCESKEVKELIGDKGSCRVVIAPKKVDKKGVCTGIFSADIPCYVTFISKSGTSALNLTCGKDLNQPILNENFVADVLSYNLATLIQTSSGEDIIQNDAKEYALVNSDAVTMFLIDTVIDSQLVRLGTMAINLDSGAVPLKDVVCK